MLQNIVGKMEIKVERITKLKVSYERDKDTKTLISKVSFQANLNPGVIAILGSLTRMDVPLYFKIGSDQLAMALVDVMQQTKMEMDAAIASAEDADEDRLPL